MVEIKLTNDQAEAMAYILESYTFEMVRKDAELKDFNWLADMVSLHDKLISPPVEEVKEPKEVVTEETLDKLEKVVETAAKTPKKRGVDAGKMKALYLAGWKVIDIADELGCSDQTVYNHLSKMKAAGEIPGK